MNDWEAILLGEPTAFWTCSFPRSWAMNPLPLFPTLRRSCPNIESPFRGSPMNRVPKPKRNPQNQGWEGLQKDPCQTNLLKSRVRLWQFQWLSVLLQQQLRGRYPLGQSPVLVWVDLQCPRPMKSSRRGCPWDLFQSTWWVISLKES